MKEINSFKIVGIVTETSNHNGQNSEDIGKLWGQFFSENVMEKIPNKIGNEIYSIYTDYESDFNGKYKTIIGLKVDSIENLPAGLIGREFKSEKFTNFTAKGNMPKAIVETWQKIWAKENELNRKYTYDFEVYGEKSQNGENSEVEIYIATE